jgi:hypothetical protein
MAMPPTMRMVPVHRGGAGDPTADRVGDEEWVAASVRVTRPAPERRQDPATAAARSLFLAMANSQSEADWAMGDMSWLSFTETS